VLSNDEEKEKKYLMSNKYKRRKKINGVKIPMKPLIGSVILCRHDAL